MTTILIVDDQPDNLYVLERLLKREGFDVVQADRGEPALELAATLDLDLIILDVMMPGIDGFEVVRRLRANPGTEAIPVVLLTANAPDQRLKIQGLNLGADEYLTQPINNHELLARIKSLLRTRQIQNALQNANTNLRTLLSVVEAGNSTLNLADAGTRLVEAIVHAADAQAGAIWLVEQDDISLLAAFGLSADVASTDALEPFARATLPTAHKPREIVVLPAERLETQVPALRRYASVLVLPLVYRDVVVGMVHLWCDEPQTLTPNDHDFLRAIVDAAATSLQNARLFDETDRQREQLKALDAEKDEFISVIAHELKNPLASIKGYAGLLGRRARTERSHPTTIKGLEVIEQQVVRMTRMLDQLRDVTQIGINRFELEPRVINLDEFVERIVAAYQSTSTAHAVEYDAPAEPLWVSVDDFRLEQVLDNMVSNAIKYSPDGGAVEVVVAHHDAPPPVVQNDDATGAWVTVTVRDHGIGIPVAGRERLFERFYRATNVKGRVSGMGLGLFISREIMQRHGGTLWVESEEGQGSLFGIALPAAEPPAPDEA